MTIPTHAHPIVPAPADLLPWADPYIMQLFAEAELVEQEDIAEQSWDEGPVYREVSPPANVVEAVLTRDAWKITNLRRPSVSRKRRTESAPPLAPCQATQVSPRWPHRKSRPLPA